MHDPHTLAFDIHLGKKKNKKGHYKDPFITIWHKDPEKDGTDDSCGWFMRERHFPKKVVDDIVKDFESEWDSTHKGENGFIYNCGWFNPYGENVLSVQAIVLNMYLRAAKIALNPSGKTPPGKMWDKAWKFINKNYAQIMYFAENNVDSLRDAVVRTFEIGRQVEYTKKERDEKIRHFAGIVASDIMRRNRKWYQHPKWHIHHWRITFPIFRTIKRKYWDKCSVCGKRGFKSSPISDWSGKNKRHQHCDNAAKAILKHPELLTPKQ